MKFPRTNKAVITFLVLASTVAAIAVMVRQTRASTSGRTIIVSQSGGSLVSLFDALTPNPTYSLKLIDEQNKSGQPQRSCKPSAIKAENRSALGKLFAPSTVQAAGCPPGLCGG